MKVRDARREAGALKDENRQLVADAETAEQEIEKLREEVTLPAFDPSCFAPLLLVKIFTFDPSCPHPFNLSPF